MVTSTSTRTQSHTHSATHRATQTCTHTHTVKTYTHFIRTHTYNSLRINFECSKISVIFLISCACFFFNINVNNGYFYRTTPSILMKQISNMISMSDIALWRCELVFLHLGMRSLKFRISDIYIYKNVCACVVVTVYKSISVTKLIVHSRHAGYTIRQRNCTAFIFFSFLLSFCCD